MKVEIKSWITGNVLFACELPAGFNAASDRVRIGAAVKLAYESGADLSDADLSGALLSGVPKIENIHQRVYGAASAEDALDMACWHTCETTHCRAGWVVHLAGDAGKAMEFCLGTPASAALIYLKSDPKIGRIPDFYCGNEEALEDMKRLAEQEAAAN